MPAEARAQGRYVDHPGLPVPPGMPCNAAAELEMAKLRAAGYRPYYISMIVPTAHAPYWAPHMAVAEDFPAQHESVVWDSRKFERPWTADALAADGYSFVGREIDGRWYSVREKP